MINIILSDYYTGDEIEGTFWNETIDSFFKMDDGEVIDDSFYPNTIVAGISYSLIFR